jgi:hypothetical protein
MYRLFYAGAEQAVTLDPAEVVTCGRRDDAGTAGPTVQGLGRQPFTQGSRPGEQDFLLLCHARERDKLDFHRDAIAGAPWPWMVCTSLFYAPPPHC